MLFLGSALLFWWALIHGPQGALGYGAAALYVFTTSVHSGARGALITFAGTVIYPAYAQSTASWGLTALEDQQLGGLIMWVPAGLVYIVAGLALCAGWLRESDRRLRQTFGQTMMLLTCAFVFLGCARVAPGPRAYVTTSATARSP